MPVALPERGLPGQPNGEKQTVDLRYVARAGLISELSRQTYDSVGKALREAVLNGMDADATRVEIDLSRVSAADEIEVLDDGTGMSLAEFSEHFMSLGGSTKFGAPDRFGRIGIGSLALLQYADTAVVETKRAGSKLVIEAQVDHPRRLSREGRGVELGVMPAGKATTRPYQGTASDHFTRVRLRGLSQELREAAEIPTALHALLEELGRLLPLAWKESRLAEALRAQDEDVVRALQDHIEQWSAPVVVHSKWERDIPLQRRWYGDEPTGSEEWSGPPRPFMKRLTVKGNDGPSRRVTVAGFLITQRRAVPSWSGLIARVQNVAVETGTFFDVQNDPGFRKYIAGEVFVMGDVDRERLINIDRASFNRESHDYRAIRRYMSRAIMEFKTTSVQRPQQQRVAVRKVIEQQRSTIDSIQRLADHLGDSFHSPLPSSNNGRFRNRSRTSLIDNLAELGALVDVTDGLAQRRPYELGVTEDGQRVSAKIGRAIAEPVVEIGRYSYKIAFHVGRTTDPAVLIRNRPREIVFNTSHPAHRDGAARGTFPLCLAVELAYLLTPSGDPGSVCEQMLDLFATL